MHETQFISLVKEHQGIVHKICGLYRNTPEDREDLFQEITFQLVKSYAIVSILSRLLLMIGVLLFFTSGIRFNTSKYLSLLAIVLIFMFQLFLLLRLWTKRLKKLRMAVESLTNQ